jgi:gamma-glutamyltranspeptidase
VDLAANGFPVSPITAYTWSKGAFAIQQQHSNSNEWGALLQPDGQGPGAGQLWKNTDLAQVLQGIGEKAAHGGESGGLGLGGCASEALSVVF